jgi:hypothetical protein
MLPLDLPPTCNLGLAEVRGLYDVNSHLYRPRLPENTRYFADVTSAFADGTSAMLESA